VIEAALFLEVSGDDVVDPGSAVKALEGIAQELEGTGDAERLALREASEELIRRERAGPGGAAPRPEVIEFYSSFMENFGPQGG
jgi:hypothetical protein